MGEFDDKVHSLVFDGQKQYQRNTLNFEFNAKYILLRPYFSVRISRLLLLLWLSRYPRFGAVGNTQQHVKVCMDW